MSARDISLWVTVAAVILLAGCPNPVTDGSSGPDTAPPAAGEPAAPELLLPADGAADTGNLVTLEWEASTGATSYDVYFGTDSPPAALAADGEGITATELAVSGLSYDTTYSWFVRAKNAEGFTDSAVRSFSTGAAPTSPPGQASDPTPEDGAVGVAPDSILQWTAADGAESYNIYLGVGSLPGSATATGITATSYAPGDLTLDAEYHWRVDAVNAVGTTTGTTEWTFAVADAASLVPAAPTIQSATESPAGSGSVALTWSDNSDVEEQYLVAYSSDGGSTYSAPVDVGANTTSYTVSGLDPEITYTLRVTAENEYGSNSDTVDVTTDAISVYHVSVSTGDDGNNGRPTTPLATITEALSRASAGDEIRVAGGTYNEVVTVNKPVSIYGSYNAAFTSRSLDPPTSFIEAGGTGNYSVRFKEDGGTITNAVYFDGFDVSIGGTRTSSWTEAITISDGAPTISNNRLTGWNGASTLAAAVGIGSSRGASALFENNYMVGSYDGPWTVTIRAFGDSSPIFRNNQIYGTLDGGGGGGTNYVYLARPNTTGKITFIRNYMDVGVNAASSANLRGLALEGETDADIFGNVITIGQTSSSSSVMYPIQIGYNGNGGPLNVRIYGNTIYTGSGGGNRTGIDVVQSTGDIEIVNNLVVTTPTSGTAYWVRIDDSAVGAPVRLENNAFSGPGDYRIDSTSLTTAADLNTAGTATASAGDVAAGNIIATPSFTDPTNGDFTLDGDTSSAIGEGGLNLSGIIGFPTADLDGVTRTAPWSIGAYEFDGPFATGYEIGDTGPAGGIVFYDKGSYSDDWRYLEAWTADEGPYQWKTAQDWTNGTSVGIGAGYANTYSAMTGTEHPAAEVVRNATHGGYDDWFLPSKDELNKMYEQRGDIGGFVTASYLSSSENSQFDAWSQSFGDGSQLVFNKDLGSTWVRAVRAF